MDNSSDGDDESYECESAEEQPLDCNDEHVCPICKTSFKNGQGLGGHMSRVHQGQSASYQRKIQVREERTFDRLMFRCAKHFHDIKYGIVSESNQFLDRAFIRRWKTKIYRYLDKDQNITI